MVYLIESHVKAWNITINYKTNGAKEWQTIYRNPELGIGYYHANLGNSTYLGNSDAVYGFIDIPITTNKLIYLSYNIGVGVALLSKHFSTTENIYNFAIGSGANAYIDFGIKYNLQISKNLKLNNAIQYTHFSNGAWRKPNLGFNIPSILIGLNYNFIKSNKYNSNNISEIKNNFKSNYEYEIGIATGVRENAPPNGEKFYPISLIMQADKKITIKRKIGAGIDIYYDKSLKDRIIADSISFKQIYNLRSGMHISHDLCFNNVSITMQAGMYFFTKAKDDGLIYSKIGLRAKFYKNFTALVLLKTHFVKADVIEWGIGYRLSKIH